MLRTRKGFSLIEMLVAMAIFAIVAFLTMMIVTQALRYNAQQQATVAAQSKLRRVVEVIGQEVRSAVFGGVASSPYASNNTQLSIYLLDQGAGYSVATETNFETLSSFRILTESQPTFKQVLLVDSQSGNADSSLARLYNVVLPASNINSNTWQLNHPSCTNGIPHNRFLQAFGVKSLGFRFDAASKQLMLSEDGIETAMAFGITDFKIEYVYQKQSGGAPHRRSTPFLNTTTGLPDKIHTEGTPSETYILSELQVTISTEEQGKTKVTRTYTGNIPLLVSSNNDFITNGVNSGPESQNRFSFSGVRLCN
jgi:prepilin-type N-terminal cleavage/methylation domain-containing protein